MIAALMLILAVSGHCPYEPMTRDGVLAAERDWVDAIEQGDRVRLDCRLGSDFTDSNWQGELKSRSDAMAALAGPRPRLSLKALGVDLLGRTAIVRGLNGQSQPDGTLRGTVRFTDIFIYREGRWQALSAQETPVRQ
ncbi:MAG TPA: nuclear transport factor 2 family protein [Rhizomicrobium sp.]|nr:nuclear transport factor 2 family protein [Rhizomicrobium sp.]